MNIDATLPPVFVDAAGLENALLNLAVNARDAMPNGGTLTISTELATVEEAYPPVKAGEIKPGTYACLTMADSGHGMSRETMERAFEPFFSTKPRGKGTGLGLSMVYGFTRQSGGTVRLYSEVGYGTSVSLYLPLAEKAAVPRLVSPARTRGPQPSGAVVLVVDDEVDLLEIACTYLAELGYTCFSATNAASALQIVSREGRLDLILTDVIMPGMNGADLVQHVRKIMPRIKVIYSSGFSADSLAERGGTLVDGILLHKPYQRSEFATVIRNVMENP